MLEAYQFNVRSSGEETLLVRCRALTPGSSAVSLVNGGLEGFMRAAALEAPRNIRVNAVSPGFATETLLALKMDPA